MFSAILARFLPPPGPARRLSAAELISTVGDGVYYVCLALYFTRIVGLSPLELGAGLTVAGAVGLIAGTPVGHLADRYGPRGVSALTSCGAGLAVSSYLLIDSFVPFVVAASFYALCQRGGTAAQAALLFGLVGQEKVTEIRAYIQVIYNAGLSVGATLGAVALVFDTKPAYLAVLGLDAVTFFLAALVVMGLPRIPAAGRPDRADGPVFAVLRDRPYALISVLNMLLVLHVPLIDIALPLWVGIHTEAPRWVISALFVLNTAFVVLFQVRVARRVTDIPTASRYVRHASMILFASCAVFALSSLGSVAWIPVAVLLLAATLQALGEVVQFSGTWEISFGLAPPQKQGQYQGFFGTGLTVAEMIGPVLLTSLVVTWGPPGWLVLGGIFLVAGYAFGPAVRWAERTRPHGPAAPPGRRPADGTDAATSIGTRP